MLTVMGLMCIIPIFLIVFIPALMTYSSGLGAMRQKILNALEVRGDHLGDDGQEILSRLG